MGRLNGKVALITGAGQGIGLAVAQLFADEGASLVLTGRVLEKLEAARADLEQRGARVALYAGDASRPESAQRAVVLAEEFGGLDVLVNNAQATPIGYALETTGRDAIAQTVESGLYGSIYHMQAAFPLMKARGGGSIINMGSRQGMYGAAGWAIYAATKEAIRGLTRAAAREWGMHNIRVNVIAPSAMSDAALQWTRNFPDEADRNLQEVSLRRWGDSLADIAPAVLFLASDDSRYVSGQTINVDGGMQML